MTSFTSKRILNIEFDDKEKGHPYEMKYFCLGYLLSDWPPRFGPLAWDFDAKGGVSDFFNEISKINKCYTKIT